jgi:hypothetical protein
MAPKATQKTPQQKTQAHHHLRLQYHQRLIDMEATCAKSEEVNQGLEANATPASAETGQRRYFKIVNSQVV